MNKSDIVMYLGFFLLISGFIIIPLTPMEKVKTDCFDRYGSQIEGLECNKNVAANEWFALSSILCILFGAMMIMYSFLMADEEATRRW